MTVDRRTLLRTGAGLAALTAGGLLSACDDPASPTAAAPTGPPTAAAGPPEAGTDPASDAPATPDTPDTPVAPGAPSAAAAPNAAAPALAPGTPDEVVNGPRDRPAVALTFHGQGDPALATALLLAAEQRGARLTVLVVGRWLDEQPQMARRILDGGHELGNHTQNHLNISAMSPDQARAEIAQCADRLQRLTGSIGTWFRPSAAQYATPVVREQARLVGYRHCLSFDVDPHDYSDPGPDAVRNRVLTAIKPGSVVALHLGHRGTVDALPGLLDSLAARGLKAVTASQLCA